VKETSAIRPVLAQFGLSNGPGALRQSSIGTLLNLSGFDRFHAGPVCAPKATSLTRWRGGTIRCEMTAAVAVGLAMTTLLRGPMALDVGKTSFTYP
jgi:hypothetical protein